VPDVLIHEEIDRELRNLAMNLESQGVDFERFVKAGGLDLEKFHEERHEEAEERVKQELVLDALAEKEGIEPTEEHVAAEARRGLEGSEDADRLLASERVQAYVRERLRLQWALLWLAAAARGETWTPPTPEEMSPAQASATEVLNPPTVDVPPALVDLQGRPLSAPAGTPEASPAPAAEPEPEAVPSDPGGMTEL
jgi:FKBP-type peptidyl-prolyl cis-trans isomerase (trigger factor)